MALSGEKLLDGFVAFCGRSIDRSSLTRSLSSAAEGRRHGIQCLRVTVGSRWWWWWCGEQNKDSMLNLQRMSGWEGVLMF